MESVIQTLITATPVAQGIFPIQGITSLLQNNGARAIEALLNTDAKKGRKRVREPRNPERDFRASLYPMSTDVFGHPADAFTKALRQATKYQDWRVTGLTAGKVGAAVTVIPDDVVSGLVLLTGAPRIHQRLVRNATGVPDVRFRAEWPAWSARLLVEYSTEVLGPEQVFQLVYLAGLYCGVGDWRPSAPKSPGFHGKWHVIQG